MIDMELYGGKKGLLAHVRARALHAIGAYTALENIDWAAIQRLVFVCKGNICRSPYASARARLLGVPAVSFGLEAVDGAPADPAALRNAHLRGVDISTHQSARMQPPRISSTDLIIVFEPWQVAQAQRNAGQAPVSLLGIWARPIHPHVQDPFGRSDRYFQHCFSLIDANVAELVERMPMCRATVTWHQP